MQIITFYQAAGGTACVRFSPITSPLQAPRIFSPISPALKPPRLPISLGTTLPSVLIDKRKLHWGEKNTRPDPICA